MQALGWVADEAVASPILRFGCTQFDEAVVLAMNHSGDSDSTGAITGNICGALMVWRGRGLNVEFIARRLERWRSQRRGRSRIPDSIWAATGQLAREHGVSRVAEVRAWLSGRVHGVEFGAGPYREP